MSFTTQSGQAVMMDGKALAKEERERLKAEVATFTEKHGFAPGLAVVLVGNDPASIDYSGVLVRHGSRIWDARPSSCATFWNQLRAVHGGNCRIECR